MSSPTSSVTGSRCVTVDTDDGVRLAGVVVHGFTGSIARPSFLRLAGWLRRFGEVRGSDARGHGRSGGRSAVGGDPEVCDVAAARADGARAVVTVGMSLGGGVVLRQEEDPAAPHRSQARGGTLHRGRWYIRDTAPMRRVHWLLEAPLGRRVAARAFRSRLDVVDGAAGVAAGGRRPDRAHPAAVRHGDRDTNFPLEHLRALVRAAGPTATAWVVPGFGHAESGATAPLVERIGRRVSATIGP